MIVRLYESSLLAFLVSVGLLLSSVFLPPDKRGGGGSALLPLAGISWCALELNLLAAIVRVPFQFVTHFADHWLTTVEITASILLLGTLVASLRLGVRPEAGSRPRETFPAALSVLVCLIGASALGCFSEGGIVPYTSLACSTFIETAAMIAQHEHFGRTKRMPARASHALALLALSRALRLVMWVLMCWAGEYERALMLADTAHCALTGRFILAWVRSRRAGTSELILATTHGV
jgi:hypothetical protein